MEEQTGAINKVIKIGLKPKKFDPIGQTANNVRYPDIKRHKPIVPKLRTEQTKTNSIPSNIIETATSIKLTNSIKNVINNRYRCRLHPRHKLIHRSYIKPYKINRTIIHVYKISNEIWKYEENVC